MKQWRGAFHINGEEKKSEKKKASRREALRMINEGARACGASQDSLSPRRYRGPTSVRSTVSAGTEAVTH